jgi:glucose-1-phosphate adenylyltransferase
MAGGMGGRLYPLTRDRAKPATPFGGKYRIIDFVLSNFVNSGFCSIYVLTQFKSQSLIQHLEEGWALSSGTLRDRFITPVPAQMQTGDDWYRGTADAVYQNLHLIKRARPRHVAVFGADHIYRMDIRQMLSEHEDRRADVTVAALPVKVESASQFGVLEVDEQGRVERFSEKPRQPRPLPDESDQAFASMGNYLFNTDVLLDVLSADAADPGSSHDFGHDLLPALCQEFAVHAYDFRKNHIPLPLKGEEPSYWRDVGTIEAYYDANMDLCAIDPSLNLYNASWPIRTMGSYDPPAKFVLDEEGRRGMAVNSIVGEGTIISGSMVRRSVIGRNVRVHSYAEIEDSILMDDVDVGRGCVIKRAIIDKNVAIPPGTRIGWDTEADRRRYFATDTGIVVIPREEPEFF